MRLWTGFNPSRTSGSALPTMTDMAYAQVRLARLHVQFQVHGALSPPPSPPRRAPQRCRFHYFLHFQRRHRPHRLSPRMTMTRRTFSFCRVSSSFDFFTTYQKREADFRSADAHRGDAPHNGGLVVVVVARSLSSPPPPRLCVAHVVKPPRRRQLAFLAA